MKLIKRIQSTDLLTGLTASRRPLTAGRAVSRIGSRGFTIVELMIATAVFSAILILITTGVLYFSRSYYASINRSTTQNTARTIVSNISQAIQFTGVAIATTTDTGSSYFCAGGNEYAFKPGVQYQGGTASVTNPGLYVVPATGCPSAAGLNYNDPKSQQLLGKGMRIASMSVTKLGNQLYSISLTLAYGDDDLLSATTGSNVACKSQLGSQFCAVSSLNVTVQRRLQDSQLGS